MFPSNSTQWWNAVILIAGGTLGFALNPLLWFTWPWMMAWWAFLMATAAHEGGWQADPPVTVEPQSRGILQFNEDSRTLPFALESFGMPDWRLSPFWSGFAAAYYINAVEWSSPLWLTMTIPLYGTAIARYSWVHSTSEESARLALTDAWSEWSTPLGAQPPIHRNTYLAWYGLFTAPWLLVWLFGAAMRAGR